MPSILLLVPALLASYVFYTFVTAYWKLRHFKGPRIAAWTDWYFVWLSISGKQHILIGDLVDHYGNSPQPPTISLTP